MSETSPTVSILDAVGQKQLTQSERFEKVRTLVHSNSSSACTALAAEVADLIRARTKENLDTVLGLATGSTPVPFYRELIRLHREEGLSFRRVITFNLDEYYGLSRDHPESYLRFMRDQLFDHVDLDPSRTHIPDGTVSPDDVYDHCLDYERRIADAGGIDLQILGIGRTGHIGFNEPGSPIDSPTRMIVLDRVTRQDAAADFMGIANVPRSAITMGVGTILAAKRLVLMAWGAGKAEIVREAVEGPISDIVSASFLQTHSNATFLLDAEAASGLTRFRQPWRTGQIAWDVTMQKRATVWLSRTLEKPILKLLADDYAENGIGGILTGELNTAEKANEDTFQLLRSVVNGDVIQASGQDNTTEIKKILIFSPDPLDGIVGMGATLARLIAQGHDVHLAVQTSGNLRVTDSAARGFSETTKGLTALDAASGSSSAMADYADEILRDLDEKGEFGTDSPSVRALKSQILRADTNQAIRILGLEPSRIHFIDASFYENGRYRRFRFDEADLVPVRELLDQISPDLIFVTGDANDPSSPQRIAFRIFAEVWQKTSDSHSTVWLYAGSGKPYGAQESDLSVPVSPDQLKQKADAIRRFRSVGADETADAITARDRRVAVEYDTLGLAEYEALETFRRWTPPSAAEHQ